MTTTQTAERGASAQQIIVNISGRVSAVDSYPHKRPTRWTTLLRLPAADEYSTPATVEVVSDRDLAAVGEVISVRCEVSGRYRSYNVTDKETGEQRTVRTADNFLTVVA